MIIILEGPDNAGKSTLAERLSKDLNIEVVHPGGPPKNIAEAISRCVEQNDIFNMSTDVDFIFDRVTCISDMIYRGNVNYHNIFGKFQSQIRLAKNVVVVMCMPSDDQLKNFGDHVTKEHETEAVVQHAKDNVDRIISEYKILHSMFESDPRLEFVSYDFEIDDDSFFYKELRSMIQNRLDQS